MPIQDFAEQAFPLLTVFVFVFGACIGSFLNVCIWRLPRGESLVHPGSHCPRCGHEILPWENIPLVSWLLLRGRCSSCRLPISVRYPLIEGATALLFGMLWLRVYFTGLPLAVLPGYLLLGAVLIAAAIIDLEHTLIPDALTLFGLAAAVLLAVLLPESHPLTGGPGGTACPEHFWSLAVLDLMRGPYPGPAGAPRVGALLDAVLGGLVGMGALWAVRELARSFWGAVKRQTGGAVVPIALTSDDVRIGDAAPCVWRDMLGVGNRTFSALIRGVHVRFKGESGTPKPIEIPESGELRVVVRAGTVRIGAATCPLAALETINGEVIEWREPREVLGLGDVKLLGTIGAFLGPEAAMFVLLLSSLTGTLAGLAVLLRRRARTGAALPYGPFLAAAALIWMLAGSEIVNAYGQFLLAHAG